MVFDFMREAANQLARLPETLCDMSAELIASTLSLPIHIVEAAEKAGCKTVEEYRDFADRMGL